MPQLDRARVVVTLFLPKVALGRYHRDSSPVAEDYPDKDRIVHGDQPEALSASLYEAFRLGSPSISRSVWRFTQPQCLGQLA